VDGQRNSPQAAIGKTYAISGSLGLLRSSRTPSFLLSAGCKGLRRSDVAHGLGGRRRWPRSTEPKGVVARRKMRLLGVSYLSLRFFAQRALAARRA
jgi:hypothetical protein